MAATLAVSPSYLNHLERNQRPVTAQVLLRLAEAYDVDLKSFAAEGADGTGPEQLAEIFADPMFADFGIPRYELLEVADNAPAIADALSRLYAAFTEMRRQPPVMVDYTLFFEDWQPVDGVRFPHKIRRAAAGATTEEWTVTKVQINPKIDQKRFAVKG